VRDQQRSPHNVSAGLSHLRFQPHDLIITVTRLMNSWKKPWPDPTERRCCRSGSHQSLVNLERLGLQLHWLNCETHKGDRKFKFEVTADHTTGHVLGHEIESLLPSSLEILYLQLPPYWVRSRLQVDGLFPAELKHHTISVAFKDVRVLLQRLIIMKTTQQLPHLRIICV